MITKQIILASFAAMILGVGAAHAGPCNTGGKDAGSGPTPGYTVKRLAPVRQKPISIRRPKR
ncbi:MAG: hypothetical protein QOH35_3548 [Acidobacteriaceae bacterium]|jgi:hypothetical protein|nr:hypothetical protein [Acidobacteriaceae bacterium]